MDLRAKSVAAIATAIVVAVAVARSRSVEKLDASDVSATEEVHSSLQSPGKSADADLAIPHRSADLTSTKRVNGADLSAQQYDRVEISPQSLQTEIEQEARQYLSPRLARLDKRLAESLPDSEWNPVKEIAAYISRVDPASQAIYSQCAADLCKLTITHGANDGKRRFLSRLDPRISMPWAITDKPDSEDNIDMFAGGVLINGYEDVGATYLYVSRPGRNFGDLPEDKSDRDLALLAAQRDLLHQISSMSTE